MTWSKRALGALVLAVLFAAPAAAQIVGRPVEVSGGAGAFVYDTRAHVKSGLALGGSVGIRWMPWLVFEGHALYGPSQADIGSEPDQNFLTYGLDFRMNVRPADSRIVPYVITGLGYASSENTTLDPEKLERGAPSLGAGVLYNVFNQRTFLRLQARDVFFRDRDSRDFSNHLAVTVGLHHLFWGGERDQDLDGVRDWIDKCRDTEIGARVDADGCPTDADADSVWDGIDQCNDTPRGCVVDRTGCSVDSDGDGVCDGLDECPDTVPGKAVDAKGCVLDPDDDGVNLPTDTCPDTPRGCKVDANGCPVDSDGDGVCDGLDKCPELGAGFEVDADGCPTQVLRRERELLDTGRIRLRNVNFASGKAELDSTSFEILDIVGATLGRWPQLEFEIGGHTDSKGSPEKNQTLSEERAGAVRAYLLAKYPNLDPEKFTVKGYGSSRPVASNATEEGRANNRRVEFLVMNRDVLLQELQQRKLMEQMQGGEEGAGPR